MRIVHIASLVACCLALLAFKASGELHMYSYLNYFYLYRSTTDTVPETQK